MLSSLVVKKFRSIKTEIRVLGIDDGYFVPHSTGTAAVVGVVYRGVHWFEGVMHTTINIDGLDATEKISAMIKNSIYYGEIRVVLLDGITFGGFNVIDITKLSQLIELPVISVVRDKPNFKEIKSALRNLQDYEKRWRAMKCAGDLFAVETRVGENPVYVQIAGISREDAEKILKLLSARSIVPEPLRVAHLIASGLTV